MTKRLKYQTTQIHIKAELNFLCAVPLKFKLKESKVQEFLVQGRSPVQSKSLINCVLIKGGDRSTRIVQG